MGSRKYSLAEIDRMRDHVGFLVGGGPFKTPELNAVVEDRLRTYMANGTSPIELEAAANKRWGEIEARLQAQRNVEALKERDG